MMLEAREPSTGATEVDVDRIGSRAIPIDFEVALSALVYPGSVGGYSAEVPALPGCFTEGETLEVVRENQREAAEGWLAAKRDLITGRSGQVHDH